MTEQGEGVQNGIARCLHIHVILLHTTVTIVLSDHEIGPPMFLLKLMASDKWFLDFQHLSTPFSIVGFQNTSVPPPQVLCFFF